VVETLGELFRALEAIIPDVLEACNNDGTAAFEKLQQMQVSLPPSPPPTTPPPSIPTAILPNKIGTQIFGDLNFGSTGILLTFSCRRNAYLGRHPREVGLMVTSGGILGREIP
jgi:hypothetical protein